MDNAGTGKTMISKYLVHIHVLGKKGRAKGKKPCIPIFYELRKIGQQTNILSEIKCMFGLGGLTDEHFFSIGDFIIVLDGFDEMQYEYKKLALKQIQQIANTKGENSFLVVTSRYDPFLATNIIFARYHINDLTEKEAFSLIRKYDAISKLKLSKNLISDIKNSAGSQIHEYLKNPLYTSLLYHTYSYKPVLPKRRHVFFSQLYDALFEKQDLIRGHGATRIKYSDLDSAEFDTVLSRLGYYSLKQDNKQEFVKSDFLKVVEHIEKGLDDIHFSAVSFLRDVIEKVPIFLEQGNNIIWFHKTLQQYYAARCICFDSELQAIKELNALYKGDNFNDNIYVIEYCADIDYSTFKKAIVAKVFGKYLKYRDREYSSLAKVNVSAKAKDVRIGLMFGIDCILLIESVNNIVHKENQIKFDDVKNIFPLPTPKYCRYHRLSSFPDITEFRTHIDYDELGGLHTLYYRDNRDAQILNILKDHDKSMFKMADVLSPYRVIDENGLKFGIPVLLTNDSAKAFNKRNYFEWINSILGVRDKYYLCHKAVKNQLVSLSKNEPITWW